MIRRLPIFLLAAGLAACASQERSGPPAPIVSATKPRQEPERAKPVAPPPAEKRVEVYAYRPPSTAPDAVAPPGAVPAEGAGPENSAPISESPTTGPTPSVPNEIQKAPPATAPTGGTEPQVVASVARPQPSASLSPAADALIKQSEQQLGAKDYVGAAATLERALGIQPQEAYIWNRLARVRMEQGLYAQAGNLASRSNALARDQVALKQDNWSMIAAARRAVGDTAGAMEAERKARGG
jgi:tetratricopeptide (TPR) repeat protein